MNNTLHIILNILLVFGAMSLYELLWSLYIHRVRDEKYTLAALFSMFIMLTNGLSLILIVNNNLMLIPAAIGAGFGTWVSKYFYTKKPHQYKEHNHNHNHKKA